jgi:hypothetical protein
LINIQGMIQVYKIWHNLCSELTSTWALKIFPQYKKQLTNRPQVITNQTDHRWVDIWDTWKTFKYLNINENRKDVDRYNFVDFFLLIVVLFGSLNIKSVKIYNQKLFVDRNVLCKRIHPNLQILNNNQHDPYGSRWLFLRIYSWSVFFIAYSFERM